NVRVSDGMNTVLLTAAVGAVTSIDAQGTGNSLISLGQSVTVTNTGISPLALSGGLQASGLAGVTLSGSYSTAASTGNTAASVNLSADTVTVAAGAVVSTRQVAAGANPSTAPSAGNSGSIIVNGQS